MGSIQLKAAHLYKGVNGSFYSQLKPNFTNNINNEESADILKIPHSTNQRTLVSFLSFFLTTMLLTRVQITQELFHITLS